MEREKELTEIKARVLALKVGPAELYQGLSLSELGLTARDFLGLRCTAEALQLVHENALSLITCGPPLRVTEIVRSHCASTLGEIEAVNGWAEASREFFAAYDECCHRCKTKKRVEAARAALHPVVKGE